jgi:hypothetical protein
VPALASWRPALPILNRRVSNAPAAEHEARGSPTRLRSGDGSHLRTCRWRRVAPSPSCQISPVATVRCSTGVDTTGCSPAQGADRTPLRSFWCPSRLARCPAIHQERSRRGSSPPARRVDERSDIDDRDAAGVLPPGPRPRRQFAARRETRQGDGRSRRSRGARREVDIIRSRRSERLVCRLLQPDTNSRSGAAVSGERQGLPLRLRRFLDPSGVTITARALGVELPR